MHIFTVAGSLAFLLLSLSAGLQTFVLAFFGTIVLIFFGFVGVRMRAAYRLETLEEVEPSAPRAPSRPQATLSTRR